MGFINGVDIPEVIKDSDVLIHVENFEEKHIKRTKYSFSTKIADSLSSKRCILAYGPLCVASMKYLYDNQVAFCILDSNELYTSIKKLCSNQKLIECYSQKGFKCYECNHNSLINSKYLRKLFEY